MKPLIFLFILSVTIVSFNTVNCLVTPKQSYFLWPNTTTGDATVFFKDGTSKPIVTLWVGYAAYSVISGVKTNIANAIAKGSVPYIQSYSFGDNGLRGNYSLAIEFDKQVAIAIGSNFAFVNLETEWDVDEVLTLFQTTEGKQSLVSRVNMYRTYAPNTIIVSSPGLWKSTSSYTFFASIDATLNARAILAHMVNIGNTTCSLKYDGTYWTNGASSLSNALISLDDTITSDLQKMNDAWGSVSSMEWIIADSGVTSCGWGEAGQAAILNVLVKNLDCLYKGGFRGFILRNAGPSISERAMGINNEGMFTYTTSPSSVTVLNSGLTRVKQLFVNNQTVNCVQSETVYTVTISTSCNDYWVQISVLPYATIQNVTFTCSGATSLLATSSWSDSVFVKGLSTQCRLNSAINVTINGKTKVSMNYTLGTSGSSTSSSSNSGSSSGNSTNTNNGTVITPTSSTVTPTTSTKSSGGSTSTNSTTASTSSGNSNRNSTTVVSSANSLKNFEKFIIFTLSLLIILFFLGTR